MQVNCVQAYLTVASTIRAGMTEQDMERAIRGELESKGITDFWYDIPIVVLVGTERFLQLTLTDYAIRSPSPDVTLKEGDTLFIDMHPRHATGCWGNFAATGIYRPDDQASVAFAQLMQQLQAEGISALTPTMTGQEVARWFQARFDQAHIDLLDVRGNYGHSMASGPKTPEKRLFLDEHHTTPIGGGIYGIEPGGKRRAEQSLVAARFEDCVYVNDEHAVILGRQDPVPIVWDNR
jgi:Xaa-Pro aminopeptidase